MFGNPGSTGRAKARAEFKRTLQLQRDVEVVETIKVRIWSNALSNTDLARAVKINDLWVYMRGSDEHHN